MLGPVAWLAFTLVRGTFVQTVAGRDYYPYPFLDVQVHGYLAVFVNIALVAVIFLAVSAGAVAFDKRLPGVGSTRRVSA